ncbi:DUF6702 family protein [Bizionia paragorgiae]|jgi:hypothetical protein|uniref:DUF6702 family protein n=1 Tax=Bizionia paragorgiae TaxID=283786 RepID=UPI00299E236C|nr:DUF6702 family protein [Bizionia paragorgiae]MDX1271992.1 DUF6702 family protein [Bizionia paragorgiae]
MNTLKKAVLLLILPLFAFTVAHKYYVSVTQIDYVEEQETVQIITRIFIDDFENVLRQRYDESLVLNDNRDEDEIDKYIEKYLTSRIQIKINNQPVTISYLGKKYTDDIANCYIEITNVKSIKSFEVKNEVLFDVFPDQKNIVRTNINSKNKSFILITENDKGLLKF